METIDKYNIFLFDMYGVLWSGEKFYENALPTLKALKDRGKIVCILSNDTKSNAAMLKEKGISNDYVNMAVTSGDLLKKDLMEKSIKFSGEKNREKVFIFGRDTKVFEGTDYKKVSNIEESDFVYISVPCLSENDYRAYGNGNKDEILIKKPDGTYNSTKIDPFIPFLNMCCEMRLPLLVGNSDLIAPQVDAENKSYYAIRQGSIAKYYRDELKGEVIEYGKPNLNIYNYTFEIEIEPEKVVMVGDTLGTDIKGVNNAKIDSILFTKTGNTCGEMNRENVELEALYEKYDARPTMTLDSIDKMCELIFPIDNELNASDKDLDDLITKKKGKGVC